MAGRLGGKVAIVTGAARGTGEQIARVFAEEGATVWVTDVLEEPGVGVAAGIGEAARFARLDVTSETAWSEVVERVLERDGRVDALVNNAAVLHLGSFVGTTLADLERLVRVNQIGPFLGMRAVFEPMKAAGRGSIVNISSVDGVAPQNGVAAYASTKWALRGLTKVGALEFGPHGIRVNAVCPEAGGPEMTRPFVPEGVDMEAVQAAQWPTLPFQSQRSSVDRMRDIAWAAVYLASDESSTCTGADFVIDGGRSMGRFQKFGPTS